MFFIGKHSLSLSFTRNFLLPIAMVTGSLPALPASATTTSTPGMTPFLCDASDSSLSEWVSVRSKAVLLISLAETSDYGGAIFANLSSISGNTSKVIIYALPSTNTSNLALELVAKATYSGGTKVFSVAPTSSVSKGTYTVCTFDFSKYNIPSGTTISNLSALVKTSSSATAGGAVYLYNFTVNGTQITRRSTTSAGCVSFQ